jgi:hypothetical protein
MAITERTLMQEFVPIRSVDSCGRTGPRPFTRIFHQTCSDGIQFDVTQRLGEMPFVEGARKKAILPEMAGLALSDMNPSRVFVVRAAKAFR